jgi:hypothetical protein
MQSQLNQGEVSLSQNVIAPKREVPAFLRGNNSDLSQSRVSSVVEGAPKSPMIDLPQARALNRQTEVIPKRQGWFDKTRQDLSDIQSNSSLYS